MPPPSSWIRPWSILAGVHFIPQKPFTYYKIMFSTIRQVLSDLLFLESVVTAIVWYVMYLDLHLPRP
jgi:hypothetical protein